jgi:hypothetical protein
LRSETFQPSFGLADQAHQLAAFFGRGAGIVAQFFAMQNDSPLVRDQETALGSAICRESSEAELD